MNDALTTMPWTDEEWRAFEGHKWTQRIVLLCSNGRFFGEYLNVFNPAELRDAQQVESPDNLHPVVSRTVYRDNVEYSSVHASEEIAKRVQGWEGAGWLKEEIAQ